jgi:hypothetical protein
MRVQSTMEAAEVTLNCKCHHVSTLRITVRVHQPHALGAFDQIFNKILDPAHEVSDQ